MPESLFPALQPQEELRVCLTCGAVIAGRAVQFHDDWHAAISSVAIAQQDRIEQLYQQEVP